MVSGAGVTIWEDLLEGHSWTMGVVLLTTVGVGLLSCLPTGSVQVTREPEVARQPSGMTLRSMRIKNHAKERTWSLSWYSGDQLRQLMELNAQYGRDTLIQFLEHVASTNENQTRCSCDERVWGEFSIWVQVAMTTCTNPSSGVTIASTIRHSMKSGPVRMATRRLCL